MKVFGIGLHRTGTSTLEECFEILGYNICPEPDGYTCVEELAKDQHKRMWWFASKFEAFQDTPWCHPNIYKLLHEKWPDSKFILTTRDINKWIISFQRWTGPGGPGFIKAKRAPIIHRTVYGAIGPLEHEQEYRKAFEAHNSGAIEYFKGTNNLLVVDWTKDGWGQLCGFLDKPIPSVRFPHVNASPVLEQKSPVKKPPSQHRPNARTRRRSRRQRGGKYGK